jgi:GT2 family glycosyltransferase
MEALVAAADAHPQAGAVGSKVLDPDGRLQSAGMILWRDGLTSPPWIGSPPDPDAFRSIRPVDYCGTASLLVRARAWDVIGGADENLYPAYYVDVDLAMSLRRHGWSVILAPESVARHHRGSSSSRRFQQFVAGRNRRVFLKKWAEDLDRYDTPYAASSAAIKRALARAEALATDCVRRPTDGLLGPSAMPAYDRIGRERRNHERNLALQKEYVASLGRSLDVAWPKRLWPPRRIPRTPRNLMRFLLGLPL